MSNSCLYASILNCWKVISFKADDAEKNAQKCNIFRLMWVAPRKLPPHAIHLGRFCRADVKLCELPFSRYLRLSGQNSGPKFRVWGSLGSCPQKGRLCPGAICTITIMQSITSISAAVAEISVTGRRKIATNIALIPHSRNTLRTAGWLPAR